MPWMSTSTAISRPSDLRLMPFGRTDAKRIRDGLWEPLWRGERALAQVIGREVTFRDETGEAIEGHEILREAILEAARADELVLDGYIAPALPTDTTGLEAPPGMDAVMSANEMGRQMLLGGSGRNDRREALITQSARRIRTPSSSPTAFIAVDLLWLDGGALVDVPLLERKRLLESVLTETAIVRRTVVVRPPVEQWFAQWHALGFREMTVKAANSRYTPGQPNGDWAIEFIPKR